MSWAQTSVCVRVRVSVGDSASNMTRPRLKAMLLLRDLFGARCIQR